MGEGDLDSVDGGGDGETDVSTSPMHFREPVGLCSGVGYGM